MTGSDNAFASRPVETVPPNPQPTVAELVSGIINDAQKLVRQQIDMLKAEVKEDIARTKRATVYGGIAVACLAVGGFALIFGIVHTLDRFVPGLPLWGAWLAFAGIFLAAGIILGVAARNLFESFNPLPDKTFNALQENITWKTAPQT